MHIFGFLLLFFILELVYFKIADRFNIIDKPNHRSSHTAVTIRGGGVIFCVAALVWFFFNRLEYPYFIGGLLAIALISFLDDILTLNNKIRLSIHLFAVLLLFWQWQLFSFPWYWLVVGLIFVIGTINAYNFMDGINGITGLYSLVAVVTLYYIDYKLVDFIDQDLLLLVGLSLVVFNFFNCRKKARCFAGDVGSVSIAFILVFAIGQLIIVTQNFAYILLLLVYGLDAATTIFFRKLRGENIFEAHRSHYYQFRVNQAKKPHLWVASGYALVQLLVNILVINLIEVSLMWMLLLFFCSLFLFLALRFVMEGKDRLLASNVKKLK